MAMTDKKRKSDYAWKRANKTALTCTMYNADAEDFRRWCEAHGLSVNQALREYVAQCLGRPLERRDKLPAEGGGTAAEDDTAPDGAE